MEYNKALARKIMRRVYYAYTLRVVSLPGVLQGLAMFAILVALTQFVSIGNVIHNMYLVGVPSLVPYFMGAFTHTEAWTLLLLGAFIFSAFTFRLKIGYLAERQFAKI